MKALLPDGRGVIRVRVFVDLDAELNERGPGNSTNVKENLMEA